MPADQATVALTSVEVGPCTGIVIGVPWVITTTVPWPPTSIWKKPPPGRPALSIRLVSTWRVASMQRTLLALMLIVRPLSSTMWRSVESSARKTSPWPRQIIMLRPWPVIRFSSIFLRPPEPLWSNSMLPW
jgi:hypothetical protein